MNKMAVNKAVEEMGLAAYLEFGAIMDALGHASPSFKQFMRTAREHGLAQALEDRDGPFRRLPRPFRDEAPE